MNEKNSILIDEYVDLKENNLENNFQQKCNLIETTPTNDSSYDLVDGDDEQTDEDQSKLNKTDTQKRRRKSSGKFLGICILVNYI